MSDPYITDLVDHKNRVAGHIQPMASDLSRRAAIHDNSKFAPEEFDAYQRAFPELQKHPYGSPEFKAALQTIQPALAHHYASNDHHPEHFPGGIAQMTLVQLVEMLCDWMAASERSQTDFLRGMEMNRQRFGIGDQLFAVLMNTVAQYAPAKVSVPPIPAANNE